MVGLFAEKQAAVLRVKAAYAEVDAEQKKRIVIKSGTGFLSQIKDMHLSVPVAWWGRAALGRVSR